MGGGASVSYDGIEGGERVGEGGEELQWPGGGAGAAGGGATGYRLPRRCSLGMVALKCVMWAR